MHCLCQRWEMAATSLLAFFSCQVRGIKFYDLSYVGAGVGDQVFLVREACNLHDLNCVQVLYVGVVEAARWATWQRKQQSGSLQCFWVLSASPGEYLSLIF